MSEQIKGKHPGCWRPTHVLEQQIAMQCWHCLLVAAHIPAVCCVLTCCWLRGRSPAAVAASGILATVIPFGHSVGDSMDLPRCFATLRLPCQARRRPSVCIAWRCRHHTSVITHLSVHKLKGT